MLGLRQHFLGDPWNYLDTVVVVFWLTDKFAGGALLMNPTLLRLVRLGRLLRLIRLAKNLVVLDALYLMTTSIRGSVKFLAWACILLVVLQMLFALLLSQVLHESYFNQPQYSYEDRQAVYRYFGTFSRAMLSMFELSMGNFPPIVWLLSEKVTGWFVLFCLMHKLTVGFAVIGVINAVFIQETFKVANQDNYILMLQRERADANFAQKMKLLFQHADDDGNATLSLSEFHALVNEPAVKVWLSSLGLCTRDTENLFKLIDHDANGELTLKEPITGALVVKGEARSIDVHNMKRGLGNIERLLRAMESRDLRRASWNAQLRDEERGVKAGVEPA